jgi:hypothetical protein
MTRTVLSYGLISGTVVILVMIATIVFLGEHSLWLGYLIMLVGLSAILVGVKQHRDQALGGVIRFWPALGLGVLIALAATVAYVAIWQIFVSVTHYDYMGKYIAQTLAEKRAAGMSAAAYAKLAQEMEATRQLYANPLLQVAETASEILPVGLLVALASAALLRNPRFLPARSRAAAQAGA